MGVTYRRRCPVCDSERRETLQRVHRSNIHPDGPVEWFLVYCECSHEYVDPAPDARIMGWLGTAHLEAEAMAACGSGCVVLEDVLGRIPDPKAALTAIRDGMAEGGMVIVIEPRRRSRRARLREWLRDYVTDRAGLRWTQEPSVLHHFTERSLRDVLVRGGFEVRTFTRTSARLEAVAVQRELATPRIRPRRNAAMR